MEIISEHHCFGGVQGFYRHDSACIGLPMQFSVYQPPQARQAAVPVLFFLAGLTSTNETFMMKAGAQRYAAEHGIMLVAPDTSPRNTEIPGASENWEVGEGAGFYLDATQAPWSAHFKMESYIVYELRVAILANFAAKPDAIGISGHSMGGHGALTLALRHPEMFRSVSALAPIAAPINCPWGMQAFSKFLGEDQTAWQAHDASALMAAAHAPFPDGILIDQGLGDKFLETQLHPAQFEAACARAQQPLTMRRHAAYDHGYYFVSSLIGDHIAFHRERLQR